MNTNSNAYTFIFAIIMVVVVAGLLAFTSMSLKDRQQSNVRNEKMQSILSSIGVDVERDAAEASFEKYITKQLALTDNGTVDENVDAFKINLKNEIKKNPAEQRYPMYLAEKDGKQIFIVPLQGKGLWDDIWGYLALDADKNTIIGASFDHKGETPGLGAEIRQSWFEDQFIGKTILKEPGDFSETNFMSVKTIKGGAKPDDAHGVDAISGGTITSDKLSKMISERLERYLPYFAKK